MRREGLVSILLAVLTACEAAGTATVIEGDEGGDRLGDTPRADTMRGFAGDDRIEALGGDDRIKGQSGSDTLFGGEDRDVVDSDSDSDDVYGGGGIDRIVGLGGRDRLYGEEGPNALSGGEGDDRLYAGGGGGVARGLLRARLRLGRWCSPTPKTSRPSLSASSISSSRLRSRLAGSIPGPTSAKG